MTRRNSTIVEYIYNATLPSTDKRLNYLRRESTSLLHTPLRVISLLIAVSGLFAMIFEVRYFADFSFQVYITRLLATIIAFLVLVTTYSEKGRNNPILLVHILLLVIIISSACMIYLIPKTLVLNSQIVGLMIFTSALFLSWEIKHQIIVAIYYNIVFASAILLNDQSIYFLPNMYESVLFVLFLSVISVIGSAVNFKLRLELAERSYKVELSEKKYKSIFEHSVEGVFQSSPEGKFLTVNPALAKMLGYSSEEELKQIDIKTDLYKNPGDRQTVLKKIREEGELKNYRVELKRKDGSGLIVRLNDRMIRDEENDVLYFEGNMEDITEQVETEERRRKAEEALKAEKLRSDLLAQEALRSNMVKSQFLANMSHEIRTPMNGIIGFLSLIERESYKSREELKQFASSAKSSAESLLDIINSILDISKIEAGKMELQEADFNLHEIVEGAISVLLPKANEKGLRIVRQVDDDTLPYLFGDAVKLRQIFLNLLGNAVKFTEAGEVRLRVGTENINADQVLLKASVEDTGIGIPKELLSRLFKPFSQIDASHTRKYSGTGLGLVICKEFISMMNGTIKVESELNGGSKFHFTAKLKVQKDIKVQPDKYKKKAYEVEAESGSSAGLFSEKNRRARSKFKILMAEDNLVNQKVAIRILSEAGYAADAVTNGEEVILSIKNQHYDLVLMDVSMPVMDGYTATALIRDLKEEEANIPIVAMTAHALSGDREKCLSVGMNDYVSKPIATEELIMVLDKWLDVESAVEVPVSIAEQNEDKIFLFDENHFDKMSGGNYDFQKELSEAYLQDTLRRIERLAALLQSDDIDKLVDEAHTIKGASYSIGATGVGEKAKIVESAGKERNITEAKSRIAELRKVFEQTEIFLRGLINLP